MDWLGMVIGLVVGLAIGMVILYFALRHGINIMIRKWDACKD